jgi:hypothetical protein
MSLTTFCNLTGLGLVLKERLLLIQRHRKVRKLQKLNRMFPAGIPDQNHK